MDATFSLCGPFEGVVIAEPQVFVATAVFSGDDVAGIHVSDSKNSLRARFWM